MLATVGASARRSLITTATAISIFLSRTTSPSIQRMRRSTAIRRPGHPTMDCRKTSLVSRTSCTVTRDTAASATSPPSAGVAGSGRGMGVLAADIDGDGRIDWLVANDAQNNAALAQPR